jgi:hypothetical protein
MACLSGIHVLIGAAINYVATLKGPHKQITAHLTMSSVDTLMTSRNTEGIAQAIIGNFRTTSYDGFRAPYTNIEVRWAFFDRILYLRILLDPTLFA